MDYEDELGYGGTTPAGECGQPWWPDANDGNYNDAKACRKPAGHQGRCGPEAQ